MQHDGVLKQQAHISLQLGMMKRSAPEMQSVWESKNVQDS